MKWFAGASLLLVVALVFGLGLLAYAMYALLGVMIVSRFLSRSWVEQLAAKRECNQLTANVGDSVAVMITIENRGSLPIVWLLAEDVLPRTALIYNPPNLKVSGKRIQLFMLPRRGRRTFIYQMQCHRRGYYQIGPLMLETGDLFGLHRRYRVATHPHFLLVYPQVQGLTGYDVSSRRPIGEVRMSHRLFEDPTRMAGVRRYEAGDPLNRIHWRATARTGVLHSKVYEPSSVVGATVLLDFHRDSFAPEHEPYRSELAITAAASLCNAVFEMGQQVGLATNARDAADRIREEGWQFEPQSRDVAREVAGMRDTSDRLRPLVVETRRGAEQLMRILETLARAELTDGLNFAQMTWEVANRLPRDATVLAILTRVTPEIALALGNLRRLGFAVTAILNIYDNPIYAEAAGLLLAEHIGSRHLMDEAALADVCRSFVLAPCA